MAVNHIERRYVNGNIFLPLQLESPPKPRSCVGIGVESNFQIPKIVVADAHLSTRLNGVTDDTSDLLQVYSIKYNLKASNSRRFVILRSSTGVFTYTDGADQ